MARRTFHQNIDQMHTGSGPDEPPVCAPPKVLQEMAAACDVQFNGQAPWDIQVYDEEVYQRILTKGSLGFGEAYMDELWDAHRLDQLFSHLLKADIEEMMEAGWGRLRLLGETLRHRLFNLQSRQRAFQVGEQHYDIGNDVFEAMLDPSMSYSCAYWHHADNLEQAQQHKLDMICRKLELKAGEQLLEIGCGWGSLARYAAENYHVEVLGITVSKEQQKMAQQRCEGLPVKIELIDYRDLQGKFDKVASVGMFEHVGFKNYTTYFDAVADLLKDTGLFLLHTIGVHKTTFKVDPWIDKYIFCNGKLPSAEQISAALDDRLLIEDWHNFGHDYAKTLLAWWDNFDAAWPRIQHKYDQRFYRMWKYYLLSCAGLFQSRQGQLWQLILSKRARSQVYRSVR